MLIDRGRLSDLNESEALVLILFCNVVEYILILLQYKYTMLILDDVVIL